ncbi:MAG TPA: hypothetical protein VGQ65_20890 [Thermoanaerobaculia bacterium]|jgi:hypothetical protein|nr:hypothetical protein [Thermoanaerobaculia bacterium]
MNADDRREFSAGDRARLFALAVGPIAVLANLFVSDFLAPSACEHGSKLLLHLCAGVFAVLALTGSLIGRRVVASRELMAAPNPSRWLGVVAFYLSIGSAIAIVAMEIPNVILRSCD